MSKPVFSVVLLSMLCFIMLYLVPHDYLCTPIIDAIMTIIINVLKFFLPFYVFVRTEKKILKHRVGFTYDGTHNFPCKLNSHFSGNS